jgi:hypothetical protein
MLCYSKKTFFLELHVCSLSLLHSIVWRHGASYVQSTPTFHFVNAGAGHDLSNTCVPSEKASTLEYVQIMSARTLEKEGRYIPQFGVDSGCVYTGLLQYKYTIDLTEYPQDTGPISSFKDLLIRNELHTTRRQRYTVTQRKIFLKFPILLSFRRRGRPG